MPKKNHSSTPLQLTWTRDPVKILGIHFSYDQKTEQLLRLFDQDPNITD